MQSNGEESEKYNCVLQRNSGMSTPIFHCPTAKLEMDLKVTITGPHVSCINITDIYDSKKIRQFSL
jgi:hypothetical protein